MGIDTATPARSRVPVILGIVAALAVAGALALSGAFDGPGSDVAAPTIDPSASPPNEDPALRAYPGQPLGTRILWGASVPGNGDPRDRLEMANGPTLDLRRSFFQWRHRDGWLLDVVSSDVAAGRIPWVSIKPPPWQDVADGEHDAEVDELLAALDELDGPVWLTFHHEPEGGDGVNEPDDPGGPAAHVAMNVHVRERMTALEVDNIALAPIFMAYSWSEESGRNPEEWWTEDVYDFLGVDTYDRNADTLLSGNWAAVRDWAGSRGIDVAVGEWGTTATGAAGDRAVREWHDAAAASWQDGAGARVVALAVYDSPERGWALEGPAREAFLDILAE